MDDSTELRSGNVAPGGWLPHGQRWFDTASNTVRVHCRVHGDWHSYSEVGPECGLMDRSAPNLGHDVHEGSLKLALTLFMAMLDYSIEYDQSGNGGVHFENEEEAFRAAIKAYLIASEMVPVS